MSASAMRWASIVAIVACVAPAAARAQSQTPDDPQTAALVGLARTRHALKDDRRASELFRQADARRPLSADVLEEWFWSEMTARLDGALPLAQRLLAARPSLADVRRRAVDVAVEGQRLDVAEALAQQGVQLEPAAPVWPRELARIADLRHDSRAGLEWRARIAALADATSEDVAAWALALEGAGQPSAAAAAWRRLAPAAFDDHADWSRALVRALAASDDAAAAADALAGHERRHALDPVARAAVVDALARVGLFARARLAAVPLLAGPGRSHWLPRMVDFAVSSGDARAVIDTVTDLERQGSLTAAHYAWRADAWLRSGQPHAAVADIDRLERLAPACDARALTLLERAGAATRLADAVLARGASCDDTAAWRLRAAQHLLAPGEEARLIALLAPLADRDDVPTPEAIGYVQALSRSGRGAEGTAYLARLVDRRPTATDARTALVDLHLSRGDADAAWTAAAIDPAAAPDAAVRDRWLRAGIRAGRAADVLRVVAALARADRAGDLRLIEASALASLGRDADAVTAFERIAADRFEAADALLFVDAVAGTKGLAQARRTADRFVRSDRAWIELVARKALLASRAGDAAAAGRLAAVVGSLDADRATLLHAEIALADGRPAVAADAVTPLTAVPSSARRALELRAAAYEALHDWSRAHDDVQRLERLAPSTALLAKEAELAWRARPTPAGLDAFLAAARAADAPAISLAAARALRSEGRASEALGWLGDEAAWVSAGIEVRAEAAGVLAQLHRPVEARRLFESLAGDGSAGADTYVEWAAMEQDAARTAVLARGLAVYPASADLLVAAARDAFASGSGASARALLERARTTAPLRLDVWAASFDVARRFGNVVEIRRLLAAADAAIGSDDRLRRDVLTAVTATATGPDDDAAATLVAWADRLVAADADGPARLMRARVHGAFEHWDAAIEDAAAAARETSTARDGMKLEAELLSYSGSYAAAFRAYDRYLAAYPDDREAATQLARVFGWAQQYDRARAQYAALVAAHPGNERLRLEAEAKGALFDGRWSDARAAYARWRAADPDDREAWFEAAQVARAGGHEREALSQLGALTAQFPPHRQAVEAQSAWTTARQRGLQPFNLTHQASGEDGRRTLSLNENGVAGGGWLSDRSPVWLGVRGNFVAASGAQTALNGFRAAASTQVRVTSRIRFDGSLGRFQLDRAAVGLFGTTLQAELGDRVRVGAGVVRDAWLESLASARLGLTTTDTRATVDLTYPRWSASASVRSREVSDDNGGWAAEGTGRLQLHAGRTEWHAFTWASQERYRHESPVYFAPGSFTRADAGLEWRRWLARPRFRDDRERSVTATYAFGVDSRQYLYHHPTARLVYELRRGLAIDARGSWLHSPSYRSTDVVIGLRVGGQLPPQVQPVR